MSSSDKRLKRDICFPESKIASDLSLHFYGALSIMFFVSLGIVNIAPLQNIIFAISFISIGALGFSASRKVVEEIHGRTFLIVCGLMSCICLAAIIFPLVRFDWSITFAVFLLLFCEGMVYVFAKYHINKIVFTESSWFKRWCPELAGAGYIIVAVLERIFWPDFPIHIHFAFFVSGIMLLTYPSFFRWKRKSGLKGKDAV